MNISYTLREGFSGFKRAKLSTFVSILTISISLILLGLFAIITKNATRVVDSIRSKVELEAFLEEPLTKTEADSIKKRILNIAGVERVTFVSKEDAAKIFREEFGEDIHKVLEFNPLPPSLKIYLKEGFRTSEKAQAIQEQVFKIIGVDDVIYRKALLEFIDKRAKTFFIISLALGIVISISAIFLVSNTIRLAIYAKRKIIQTMKLVGATRGFIRLPFILEGVIQGFLGGALAAGIIYSLIDLAVRRFAVELIEVVSIEFYFYGLVILVGTFLGFLGSLVSIRKFISESVAA